MLESIQSKGSFIVSLGRPCSVSGARSPSTLLLVREAQGNSLVKLAVVMLNLFSIALLLFLTAKLETALPSLVSHGNQSQELKSLHTSSLTAFFSHVSSSWF